MTRPTPRCLFVSLQSPRSPCALRAQGLKAGWHEDTKTGFKIKVPDKWECVPIAVEEKWIVAKYLADKPVLGKKGKYMGMEQKPQMRVIVFSDEARKFKPAEVEEDRGEGRPRRRSRYKDAEVPYKDYKDYMKRNVQDGGFYFDKEKESEARRGPRLRSTRSSSRS